MNTHKQLMYKLGGINVNGRVKFYSRLTNLKRVSRSTWTVEHTGTGLTYRIEGGRHAGGTSREWMLDGGDFTGVIDCTSLVDALHLLENM
jgi:hypothetical protein